jgi:HEAT repeat protein
MRCWLVAGLVILVGGCVRTPPPTAHGRPVPFWVEKLQDPDARVRGKAVQVLGNVGASDPAVVPALVRALGDRDALVRRAGVLALGKIGPAAREAVPALSACRHDRDARVRQGAARALERIHGGESPAGR